MKKYQNYIEYALVKALAAFIKILSFPIALAYGKCLGYLFYYFIPIRKKVSILNLQNSFPEKTEKEIKKIVRSTFLNFGQMIIEFIRFPNMDKKYLENKVIFENPELVKQAYSQNNGVICLSGHFGNWELMAAAISQLGFPMVAIAKEQRNKLVDRLISLHRASQGIATMTLGIALRGVMKSLRANKGVAILADQDAGREGIFVDFLGRPSSTAQGPAMFALKTKAPIIFGCVVRGKKGKHTVYLKEIDHSDLDGPTPENIQILTQRHAKALEEFVTKWPDHWFWMHKRWKTKPQND